MTVNYNDGKWHGWNGGECPVHPETVVECMLECGHIGELKAGDWTLWASGIVAFRVIKEHREPREWVAVVNANGQVMGCNEWHLTSSLAEKMGSYTLVKVREVIE